MAGLSKLIIGLICMGILGAYAPSVENDVISSDASTPASGYYSAPALPLEDQVMVHFIDVGQGDAIYIELPNDNNVLIDGGEKKDGAVVVDYLKAQGVDDLELIIATHPHRDHIGGLPEIMAAYDVNTVLDSGQKAESNAYGLYAESIAKEGCSWVADNRQVFTFGNIELQILTGTENWQDPNNYSVVAHLDCGEIEFLFMGDAEKQAEEMLTGNISAEILKVGHHGSSSSSSASFLGRVMPDVAVISAGAGNSYGHPHEETLNILNDAGCKMYRTDFDGNVVVTTDGKAFSVRSVKDLVGRTVL